MTFSPEHEYKLLQTTVCLEHSVLKLHRKPEVRHELKLRDESYRAVTLPSRRVIPSRPSWILKCFLVTFHEVQYYNSASADFYIQFDSCMTKLDWLRSSMLEMGSVGSDQNAYKGLYKRSVQPDSKSLSILLGPTRSRSSLELCSSCYKLERFFLRHVAHQESQFGSSATGMKRFLVKREKGESKPSSIRVEQSKLQFRSAFVLQL